MGSNPTLPAICKNCGSPVHPKNMHCSSKCVKETQYKENVRLWKSGELTGSKADGAAVTRWVRRYILERANYACERCGFNTHHPDDGKTILEIEHKDGDSSNSCEENLEALCPNCHALTSTYRGRNRNNNPAKRKYRAKLGYIKG